MNKWKDTCSKKQLTYKDKLGFKKSGSFQFNGKPEIKETILHDDDARLGANFYCYKEPAEWENLKQWAKENRGKAVNFLSNNLKHMVRSEHIVYNLFYPLDKLRESDDHALKKFMKAISGLQVDEVNEIKVEYAGAKHKSVYLDDNTSFDAFMSFKSGKLKVALGIELKYTELSYAYGETEKEKLYSPDSPYMQVAKECGYFKDFNVEELKTTKLKQPFRNHLLGISMKGQGEFDEFISIHLYPAGNSYQEKVVKEYKQHLNQKFQHTFIGLTFEDFIGRARKAGIKGDWLNYFENRY